MGRRRTGPQAIHVRRERRTFPGDEDELQTRGGRGGLRERTKVALPLEPRLLALIGAAALVLILLAVLITRPGPSPEAPTTAAPAALTSPTPVSPTAVPTQGPVQATIVPLEPTYTVAPGDTLAIIARRFNTSVDALVSINNLTDRNALRVGQRLILPNQ